MMENDFAKQNDREDVSPFLSVFLYFPAILSICSCACMCVVRIYSTVGPMGAGRSPLGLLLPFRSRFLGLNAKAKKRKEKHDEERISSNSAILCVLYWCMLKYTLSHILMRTTLPKQYLWSERTKTTCLQGALCVFVVTHRKEWYRDWGRAESQCVFVLVCL